MVLAKWTAVHDSIRHRGGIDSMRQRMWVWVGIGMFVATMLLSGVALQGGDRSSLGQGQLLAQDGGDCGSRRCK